MKHREETWLEMPKTSWTREESAKYRNLCEDRMM